MNRQELLDKKLELEVRALETSALKRPTVWLSVISVILAIIGVVTQGYLSKIESATAKQEMFEAAQLKKQAERDVKELNIAKEDLNTQLSTLEKQSQQLEINNLALENDKNELASEKLNLEREIEELSNSAIQLRQANDELQNLIPAKETLSTDQEKTLTVAENARYAVGFYSLGATESIFEEIGQYIKSQGYSLVANRSLSEKPDWLANQPTVFYYDAATKNLATTIAQKLSDISGLNFSTSIGAGYGVGKGNEKWTLFIHLLAN